jgi:hypothetical protein
MASQAALEIILQARDEASGALEQASGALGNLGGVAGKVAVGGLAAAGAAVAAVAGKAFSFSQTTDQAMNRFQAQVGASAEEMADFRTQALDVFESGWGENVEGIADAMANVNQVLGEQGDALEESTRRAMVLRDTFGVEVAEGASIAGAAVKSGLVENSEAAFDLITKGFQEGLNQAGDFGDTVREYSSDFERLGFTAEEALGALNAGLDQGAYNTDVVADGVREFGIRFGAAEESAVQALDSIGINSEELYAKYEAGEITVADAMETITGALGDVDSETLKAQAGAALFGSKWEDVGGDVFLAAGQAQDAIENMSGATDAAGQAMEKGIGPALERLWRTVQTNLAPLGDMMGEAVDQAIPHIESLSVWLSEKIPQAIDTLVSFWGERLLPALQVVWGWVRENVFPVAQRLRSWLSEKIPQAIDTLVSFWEERLLPALQAAWGWVRENVFPVAEDLRSWLAGKIPEAVSVLNEWWGKMTLTLREKIGIARAYLSWFSNLADEHLGNVVDWLRNNIPAAAREAKDAVADFGRGFRDGMGRDVRQTLGELRLIQRDTFNDLLESLRDLGQALGLTSDDMEPIKADFRIAGQFVGKAVEAFLKLSGILMRLSLKPLELLVDFTTQLIEDLKDLPDAVRFFSDAFQEGLNSIADAVPDWLVPGSPTPFEVGLRGVGDAIGNLPDLSASLSVQGAQPQMAMAGAGGGGGGVCYEIHNHFGSGSVRSYDDIEEIARRQEEILNIRGVRSWEV